MPVGHHDPDSATPPLLQAPTSPIRIMRSDRPHLTWIKQQALIDTDHACVHLLIQLVQQDPEVLARLRAISPQWKRLT